MPYSTASSLEAITIIELRAFGVRVTSKITLSKINGFGQTQNFHQQIVIVGREIFVMLEGGFLSKSLFVILKFPPIVCN